MKKNLLTREDTRIERILSGFTVFNVIAAVIGGFFFFIFSSEYANSYGSISGFIVWICLIIGAVIVRYFVLLLCGISKSLKSIDKNQRAEESDYEEEMTSGDGTYKL